MATITGKEAYGPPLRRGLLAAGTTLGTLAGFAWLFLTFGVELASSGVPTAFVFLGALLVVQAVRLLIIDGTKRRASVLGTLTGLVIAILGLDPYEVCPQATTSCMPTFDVTVFAPLGLAVATVAVYIDLRERVAAGGTGTE